MTGRQRRAVLELSPAVTLGDARALLSKQETPTTQKLGSAFNTPDRLRQLASSVERFDRAVLIWADRAGRHPDYAWVMPKRLLAALAQGSRTPTTTLRMDGTRLGKRILRDCSQWDRWLGFVSMEAVYEFRRMRPGDESVVSVMLSRAARSVGFKGSSRPWLPGYSKKLASLPVMWLYQFDTSARGEAVLRRLERAGLSNVGHLIVFHPESWKLSRRRDESEWRELARALNDVTPPSVPERRATGRAAPGRQRSARRAALRLAAYRSWRPKEPNLPIAHSSTDVLATRIAEIVETEGPIYAVRAYQLLHRASGGQRLSHALQRRCRVGTERALESNLVAWLEEDVSAAQRDTLCRSQTVVPRELGPRRLEEVPRAELAALVDALGLRGWPRGELTREVLNAYGLKRLTRQSEAYITMCAE
jgi:hypothetical protein